MINRTTVSKAEYLHHEIDALLDAACRGDKGDALSTIATLQQMLHIESIQFGGSEETCARIYMSQGAYVLPDREAEREWVKKLADL
jgi:hypothetical protein